jgi:hypothetical protein
MESFERLVVVLLGLLAPLLDKVPRNPGWRMAVVLFSIRSREAP